MGVGEGVDDKIGGRAAENCPLWQLAVGQAAADG